MTVLLSFITESRKDMLDILVLLSLSFLIYFMVGPAWAAGIVLVELIVAAVASYAFAEGRKFQEALDDEGAKRKVQVTHDRAREIALAARGIDARNHHEATIAQKVEVK